MNVNTNTLLTDDGDTLYEAVSEHHMLLANAGVTPTGTVALVPDPDPNYPGAMQVWSKSAEGTWVWIDPDGVAVYAACPMGE